MKWLIALALIGCVSAQWGDNANCGTSSVSNHGECQTVNGRRIVGGWVVTPHEIPYQVHLSTASGSFFCGGSMISNTVILTAAHCTDGQSASNVMITLGDHTRGASNSNRVVRNTNSIIQHSSYNAATTNYDISLLVMNSVSYNNYMLEVCQPSQSSSDSYAGNSAFISGWGTTSEGGSTSSSLRAVCADFITRSTCRNTNYQSSQITNQMMCAGDVANGGKDACQGDSGGPLAYKNGNKMEIVGVTSWGYGCARVGYPGVYADVPHFRSWITLNHP